MKSSKLSIIIPWLSSLALFTVLIGHKLGDKRRTQIREDEARAELTTLSNRAARRDSLLEAGQLLPMIPLVRNGTTVSTLRDIAKHHRFIYLRSGRCAGCEIVETALTAAASDRSDELIAIDYVADSNEVDYELGIEASLQRRTMSPWPFWGVPTLLVVDSTGHIISVAHADLNRVRDVLALYHFVPARIIDSIYSVREASSRILQTRSISD